MGKCKPDKNRVFTVNLKHDGFFTIKPFSYGDVDEKQITYLNFEVDLYAEHLDEDALDIMDTADSIEVDEGYDDEEDFHDVEFFHEGDDNVEIINETTKDPFLNKLCSDIGHFRGFIDEPINVHAIEVLEDPDHVDAKNRAKPYVIYLRQDPTQDWDKMEPILGMRFENSEQLKFALANYEAILVYCGRDVLEGKCAGAATLKKRSELRTKKDGEGCSKDGEGCSKDVDIQMDSTPFFQGPYCRPIHTFVKDENRDKRAKQRALFDYEGGLREHYGRLYWQVIPSGFQELEVRNGNQAYEELSGIPCIHAVAAYEHMNRDPIEGVHEWYSQQKWFEAYQFTIRPVCGSNMWKRTRDPPLLPPLMRTMPGRPRKKRILAPDENNSQVTRRGRFMTCSNCQERGHNKARCKKEPVPKPPKLTRPSNSTTRPDMQAMLLLRGRGRGSRGGGRGSRGGGRGQRGGGRGQRGGGRGSRGGSRAHQRNMIMEEDEIRKNMEHDYMEELLIQECRMVYSKLIWNSEIWTFKNNVGKLGSFEVDFGRRGKMERARFEREQDEQREYEEWEKNMGLHPSCYISDEELKKGYVPPSNSYSDEESFDQEPYNRVFLSVNEQVDTQESFARNRNANDDMLIAEVVDAPCDPNQPEANKGKAVATSEPKKKGKTRQAHDDPLRIYHKNRGRSKRIFGQKLKKTGFGPNGEWSTPDSAFSVD
ncbi:hypothetical protein CTI12_AA440880 [Artemisia annua]|uniref:Uncharacterized protein n=1 Tax=Artemisia annua TaxID=35608 RepID=A0A2U1LYC2_ARTAN|nr:hypothetical protein CTI12_AA440880 [Artemisia annua]